MKIAHTLKIHPAVFPALVSNAKRYEIRNADRGFKVGDVLCLAEWDPALRRDTGRVVLRRVTWLATLHGLPETVDVSLEGPEAVLRLELATHGGALAVLSIAPLKDAEVPRVG